MGRDRDIRNAMRDLIDATGDCDVVTCAGLPEDQAYPGAATKCVNIEPLNYIDDDLCEGADGPILLRTGTAKVTFMATDEDGAVRDETVERLYHSACDVCNGISVAGLTYPAKTRFSTLRWLAAKPPERRGEATFTYQYEVGANDFDATE